MPAARRHKLTKRSRLADSRYEFFPSITSPRRLIFGIGLFTSLQPQCDNASWTYDYTTLSLPDSADELHAFQTQYLFPAMRMHVAANGLLLYQIRYIMYQCSGLTSNIFDFDIFLNAYSFLITPSPQCTGLIIFHYYYHAYFPFLATYTWWFTTGIPNAGRISATALIRLKALNAVRQRQPPSHLW